MSADVSILNFHGYEKDFMFFFMFYVLLAVCLDNFCDENQLVALFILNLFHQTTSPRFKCIYCKPSGGIHCICTVVGMC
jgi:hypothetical protein